MAGVIVAWAAIISGTLLVVVRPNPWVVRWLVPGCFGLVALVTIAVWVLLALQALGVVD